MILASWAQAEIILLAVTLLLFIAHILNGIYSHTAAKSSVNRLVKGELRLSFVWGTLLGGLILPAILCLYGFLWANPGPDITLYALAGMVTFPGNWLSKYTVIKAGIYAPFF